MSLLSRNGRCRRILAVGPAGAGIPRGGRMRRRAFLVLLVAAISWALPATPALALSLPHPPQARQLTVSGFVIGRVAKGDLIRIGVVVTNPGGWADVHSVKLVLILRGQVLEEVAFFPKTALLRLGSRPPVSIDSSTR